MFYKARMFNCLIKPFCVISVFLNPVKKLNEHPLSVVILGFLPGILLLQLYFLSEMAGCDSGLFYTPSAHQEEDALTGHRSSASESILRG